MLDCCLGRSRIYVLAYIFMSRFTYLLLEGEKVEMDVNPDEINTVPIALDDHLIIYAVASEDDQWKLLELQKNIDLNFTD